MYVQVLEDLPTTMKRRHRLEMRIQTQKKLSDKGESFLIILDSKLELTLPKDCNNETHNGLEFDKC